MLRHAREPLGCDGKEYNPFQREAISTSLKSGQTSSHRQRLVMSTHTQLLPIGAFHNLPLGAWATFISILKLLETQEND